MAASNMVPEIFQYGELKYYGFGLRLGVANLLRNGFRLGLKKTLGKITQPINSYTRFPEYYFMDRQIQQYLMTFGSAARARILDVGSPKCFGLYLASRFDVEIHLTDLYEKVLEEIRGQWEPIRDHSKGEAVFMVQDARSLSYPEDHFDIVYSMSVVEHVEGERGDSQSIQEMIRVLKSGGLLLVSVPWGKRYVEQDRIGFQAAAHETGDEKRYFFQRIYAPGAIEGRIAQAAYDVGLRAAVTVWRKKGLISKLYGHLGANSRGLLGFANPLLSAALNRSHEGFLADVPSEYGNLHSLQDVYGDVVLAWAKR